MKALTCMALGYLMMVLFLSKILGPAASVLSFVVAFFIPHISRRDFVRLMLFQSTVITVVVGLRRDALRPFLLNVDYFTWIGLWLLLLVSLLIESDIHLTLNTLGIDGLEAPSLKLIGALGFFGVTMSMCFLSCFLTLLLIRMFKLRKKVGKVYPERWWRWKSSRTTSP